MTSFELFVIAHLIADYLLQNKWMALNKGSKLLPIILHTLIYGICMGIAFPSIIPIIVVIACLHGLVDRYSLGDRWLSFIKGRSFDSIGCIWDYSSDTNKEMDVAFTCIVYVTVDFLIHFLISYPLIKLAL